MEAAYRTTIALGRVVLRALDLRVDVVGAEHVPRQGPVLLAANHVSFLDFLLVGLAARDSGRLPRFLARHDVWHHRVAGPFMTAMRHVPVDPAAPAAAYLEARRLLRAGEAVAVFPEAGISTSFTVRPLMPGVAALAAETGAPVVPVALWGGQRIATAHRPVELRRHRPVSVRVGEGYGVRAGSDPRAATVELGRRLQGMLDALQVQDVHRPADGERAPWYPAHLGGSAPSTDEARRVETTRPRRAVPVAWQPGGTPGRRGRADTG